MHAGINEAGSVAAFTAAGTAYATHGEPLIPVYVFYSMFGFQRTGDSFWAAGDQMTRGFIIGATAGRTTLTGEGLQHADGHSPILASTNPAVITYDPAYGYEIGAHHARTAWSACTGRIPRIRNVMYYITVYNEPIIQPKAPENLDVEGIIKGIYLLEPAKIDGPRSPAAGLRCVRALGPGSPADPRRGLGRLRRRLVRDVLERAAPRRPGRRGRSLPAPGSRARVPFVTARWPVPQGPVVAVTDYMKAVPDQIRQFLPNEFATLGADGFGFSDTRAAARRYFKIDSHSMVVRTLQMLAKPRRGRRRRAAPGDQQVRPAQRQRRHHRQRRRRRLGVPRFTCPQESQRKGTAASAAVPFRLSPVSFKSAP